MNVFYVDCTGYSGDVEAPFWIGGIQAFLVDRPKYAPSLRGENFRVTLGKALAVRKNAGPW